MDIIVRTCPNLQMFVLNTMENILQADALAQLQHLPSLSGVDLAMGRLHGQFSSLPTLPNLTNLVLRVDRVLGHQSAVGQPSGYDDVSEWIHRLLNLQQLHVHFGRSITSLTLANSPGETVRTLFMALPHNIKTFKVGGV